ncbi:hypothetical protein OAX71_02875 [Pseudomonadales bacterium]|nr:hypothetical protein [Pseudomonadales bacterium]
MRNIMRTGAMFGFSENLMRVSLSRLAAKGTVENFKRGYYRLTDSTDHLNDFIEEWRLGDARRRDWHRNWVLAQGDSDSWALNACGFLYLDKQLWVRPDNLKRSAEALQTLLENLGASSGCIIATDASLSLSREKTALERVALNTLQNKYAETIIKLKESLAQLNVIPTDAAQKECFYLGGTAIQVLALDPLLPEEIQPGDDRRSLWTLMLEYDQVGRAIWRDKSGESPITLPTAKISTG